MNPLKVIAIVLAALFVGGWALVYAGVFNVAADEPHWGLTVRLIESTRERSIVMRADAVTAPALDDPELIAMGAEHYSEMCTDCHLAPGMQDTELRKGLYPKPPNLAEHGERRSPEQVFWVIKHGLKMTAMPAWGVTHDDRSIWGMVAFLKELPGLSPDAYRDLVAPKANASEHDHGTHSHDATTKTPAASGAPLPAGTDEPVAAVDRFFRALAAGDTQRASTILDPAVLVYESGGAERSREEYASHHLASDAAFLKTAKHRLLSRTGAAVGDLAWVATESRLTAPGSNGATTNVVSTETMVLRKTGDGWRIVHIHWSSRAERT